MSLKIVARWSLILVLVFLTRPLLYAKNSSSSVVVAPNSVEATNIQNAAEFIRSMGNPGVANNILQMLNAGKIYSDATMSENGDTSGGDITINTSLVRHSTPNLANSPFDGDRHFTEILALARTLLHEKVHVHQSGLFIAGSNLKLGATPHEAEAWEETINALNSWFQALYAEYRRYPVDPREVNDPALKRTRDGERLRLLKRAIKALDAKISYVGDYKDAKFMGSPNAHIFTAMQGQLQQLKTRLIPVLNQMEEQQNPPSSETNDEIGRLMDQEKELGQELARSILRMPKDTLILSLVGQGRAAGHIFDLEVSNPSEHAVSATLPVGLALVSSHQDYQTMMIGEPLQVEVGPGQKASLAVKGYCLDHGKLPPPQGLRVAVPQQTVNPGATTLRRDAAGRVLETTTTSTTLAPSSRICTLDPKNGKVVAIRDQVQVPGKLLHIERDPLTGNVTKIQITEQPFSAKPTPQPSHPKPPPGLHYTPQEGGGPTVELLGHIATVGNRLSQDGRLASNIQSPDRYRATIVQRAIWSFVNGLDEQALLADTREQVSGLPPEKRPSDPEVVKTVDRIWDDVDLTLKTAGVAR